MHWSWQTPTYNNTRDNSKHGYHQMVNMKIRLIIFFAVKDGEAPKMEKTVNENRTRS